MRRLAALLVLLAGPVMAQPALVAELSVRLASTAFGLLALGAAITTLRVLSTGGGDSEQPRPSDQAEAAAAAQP